MFSCLQTKIKEAFAAFDTNQSGDISMEELRALLGQLGEIPSEKHLQVGQVVRYTAHWVWFVGSAVTASGRQARWPADLCVYMFVARSVIAGRPGALVGLFVWLGWAARAG